MLQKENHFLSFTQGSQEADSLQALSIFFMNGKGDVYCLNPVLPTEFSLQESQFDLISNYLNEKIERKNNLKNYREIDTALVRALTDSKVPTYKQFKFNQKS